MSLWVDKCRPTKLDNLDYHKEQAAQLKRLVCVPHIQLPISASTGMGADAPVECRTCVGDLPLIHPRIKGADVVVDRCLCSTRRLRPATSRISWCTAPLALASAHASCACSASSTGPVWRRYAAIICSSPIAGACSGRLLKASTVFVLRQTNCVVAQTFLRTRSSRSTSASTPLRPSRRWTSPPSLATTTLRSTPGAHAGSTQEPLVRYLPLCL